ncbi:hypothetical protein FRC14_004699 [Serendipita sp. 396]|nr:hypothetical protein FRC14_004699 [Serendipita sp. 396]
MQSSNQDQSARENTLYPKLTDMDDLLENTSVAMSIRQLMMTNPASKLSAPRVPAFPAPRLDPSIFLPKHPPLAPPLLVDDTYAVETPATLHSQAHSSSKAPLNRITKEQHGTIAPVEPHIMSKKRKLSEKAIPVAKKRVRLEKPPTSFSQDLASNKAQSEEGALPSSKMPDKSDRIQSKKHNSLVSNLYILVMVIIEQIFQSRDTPTSAGSSNGSTSWIVSRARYIEISDDDDDDNDGS